LLEVPQAPTDSISVELIGKLDGADGSVITNPASVLYDLIKNIAGLAITRSQLDGFRVECHNADIEFTGVIGNAGITNRAQADIITKNAGAVWSLGMPDVAKLYPPNITPSDADHDLALADQSILSSPEPQTSLTSNDIKTVLVINYAWDHVENKATKSLRLASNSKEAYGTIEETLDLRWIGDAKTALSIGKRLLTYKSRPLNVVRFSVDFARNDVLPGQWISVNHPYNPSADDIMFVTNAEIDPQTQIGTVSAQCNFGESPSVIIDSLSSQFSASGDSLVVRFGNGFATIVARDKDGAPLPGALITLDGVTRRADRNGEAVFQAEPGLHTLRIEAAGQNTFYTDEYLIAESS